MGTSDPDDGDDTSTPAEDETDAGTADRSADGEGQGNATQGTGQGKVRDGHSGGGQPQGQPGGHQQQQSGGDGLDPNVAGALCYVLGWLSGVFFLITEDEDEFVRFHAAQSIVVFGGLTVLWIVLFEILTSLLFSSGVGAFALFNTMATLLRLAGLVAWLGLMYVAYDGRWFEVPVAADLAYDLSEKRDQPVQQRPPEQPP